VVWIEFGFSAGKPFVIREPFSSPKVVIKDLAMNGFVFDVPIVGHSVLQTKVDGT
jgi:hypothetical protein